MPSSTFKPKEYLSEKKYKEMELVSTNNSLFQKPAYSQIYGDIEVFDNRNIIVRTKKGNWYELEELS